MSVDMHTMSLQACALKRQLNKPFSAAAERSSLGIYMFLYIHAYIYILQVHIQTTWLIYKRPSTVHLPGGTGKAVDDIFKRP